MSVRVSPVSRTASLLIVAVGIFTLIVGQVNSIQEDTVAGIVFIMLGIVLYGLLYRMGRKL